jgi:uncharacterized protein RhaS with RHS repeats
MLTQVWLLMRRLAVTVLMLAGLVGSSDGTAGSVSYTYDRLGRVRTAVYDNGLCVAYAYDANGNRTSQVGTLGGTPAQAVWGTGEWGCFTWTP